MRLKFLYIDTSDDLKTIVMLVDGDKYQVFEHEESRSHLKVLAPMIKNATDQFGIKISELDFIGLILGPGSWTGLRVGVSTSKVLSFINQIPIIGLNNFDLMQDHYQSKKGLYLIRCSSINYYFRNVDGKVFSEGLVSEEEVLRNWENSDKFYLPEFSPNLIILELQKKYGSRSFSDTDSLEPFYLTDGKIVSNFKVAKK